MNDKSVDVTPQYRRIGEVVNATTSWTLTDDSTAMMLLAMQLTQEHLVRLGDVGQRKRQINECVDKVKDVL